MSRYIDKCTQLFAQPETLEDAYRIAARHRAPLLLTCLSGGHELQSTVAALRLKGVKEPSSESVTVDSQNEANKKVLDMKKETRSTKKNI